MKFQVLDNGKTTDSKGFPRYRRSKTWNKSLFDTLEEAYLYADSWLDVYGPMPRDRREYEYSGYGDKITIIEVP